MTEGQIWTIIIFAGTVLLGFMGFMGVGMGLLIKGWRDLSVDVGDLSHEVKDSSRSNQARFDSVEAKLAEHDERFDRLEAAGERMAEGLYALAKKLDDHLRWHAS